MKNKKQISKKEFDQLLKEKNDLTNQMNDLLNNYNQIANSKKWKIVYQLDQSLKSILSHHLLIKKFLKTIFKIIKFFFKKLKVIYHFYKKIKEKIKNFIKEIKQKKIIVVNKKWPKNKPLISVIIPCFNYGNYIEEAIDSVLNQTFQNFEILVIDGGSTDGSTIKFLKKLNKPKTKIYFRKGKHLVGDNRNFGINLAKGKYICCLDADDILLPVYFEKALFLLETYRYDVVHPSVKCFGKKNEIWHTMTTTFETMNKIGNTVSTVAIFTKEAWKKSGGYKDWPIGKGHVPEDWEFWYRLLGQGFRFRNINEPLMLYRVHDSSLTAKNKNIRENQKLTIQKENLIYFSKKYIQIRKYYSNLNYEVINPYINLYEKR